MASGLAAYVLWGLFPLYFPLLEPAGGVEIVAHRVLWSLLFIAVLLTVAPPLVAGARGVRRPADAAACSAVAAVLIAVNWLIFVYGVNSGHVVETSLGLLHQPAGQRAARRRRLPRAAAPAAVGGGRPSPPSRCSC